MSDEQKREARRFEPPPWEKDAFEALARKKAEEQEALEALAAARAVAGAPAGSPMGARAAEVPASESESKPTAAGQGSEADPGEAAEPVAPAIDERQVQVMLLELGREETSPTGHVRLISRIASLITGATGLGMIFGGFWALQATDQARRTGVALMGSGALSVFGLCFAGIAVWVWIRSNRVRGSL